MISLTRRSLLKAFSGTALLSGCGTFDVRELVTRRHKASEALTKIAMGSCLRENRKQPVWKAIRIAKPDLFVHLGDNVYADTYSAAQMRSNYARLWSNADYQALRRAVPVIAIWDDHDYGWNNSGAEYSMKFTSREIFCDFFGELPSSPRRLQPGGIYTSYIYGPPGKRTQIILLDVRYERTHARMLGNSQWRWLEAELLKPAELRLIASGSRVVAEGVGSEEAWENIPEERHRLFALINRTGAEGVMFVSGDPHYSDYAVIHDDTVPYPLWDMTSSALNQSSRAKRYNSRRRVGPYVKPNFGYIQVNWSGPETSIRLETRSVSGKTVLSHEIPLRTLSRRLVS